MQPQDAPAHPQQSGPVAVADLTIGQIQTFYRHGYDLTQLQDMLTAGGFVNDPWYTNAITGVFPWCNLYGLMEPTGDCNT